MEPITITLPAFHFEAPESTDDIVIFPFSYGSQKFSKATGPTKLIQGKASLNDVNDVLTIFELLLSRAESTRKFFMSLFLPIFILYLLTCVGKDINRQDGYSLQYASVGFILIFFGYSLYKRMRETGRTKADIQRMLEMIRPAYAKRGLTWNFSQHLFCSWLELRKESQQESSLSVEVHTSSNQESFIPQNGRIFEEFQDGENIVVCAGKNLTGPEFSAPFQCRYVIHFIIWTYISILLINNLWDSSRYYNYYNRYYY